jgi:hypothetical protein
LIKKRNKKIKTSEFFFEFYERLFLPAFKAASLSCLLSASPHTKAFLDFYRKPQRSY